MQGGKRENAGRKNIDETSKKIGYKVYLSPELVNDIEKYGEGTSFSRKCSTLINEQIIFAKHRQENTIRIIDLFAGLGGIRIGFEQAMKDLGYYVDCVFSSEIKKYAVKAYENYFNENNISDDIRKIEACDIPDFDFLLGGFPCQAFSSAGKGLGFADTRGTLFFEIERILKEKKPYGFLLENVEGLINHDKGKTLKIIISKLKKLGYSVNYQMLDAKDFGLAQSRKRVYIVGTKDIHINLSGFKKSSATFDNIMEKKLQTINSRFTKCLFKHYSPAQVLGKSIKDKRGGINNIHSWDIELKGKTTKSQKILLTTMLKERRKKKWANEIGIDWMDGMPLTTSQILTFIKFNNLQSMLDDLVFKGYLKFEYPKKLEDGIRVYDTTKPKGYNIVAGKLSFEFTKILDPYSLTPTLVAMDVSKLGIVDNGGLRKLTIREGMRLCGYPEDYNISFLKEKEAFDLLGNTVCIPVIKDITTRIGETCYIEKKSLEQSVNVVG